MTFLNFVIEYFGEIENTEACLSGAWMNSFHDKNGGRKSRDTLPLTNPILAVKIK